MKIEFLAEGSLDCPLIRMFEYTTGEVQRLAEACIALADGRGRALALHDETWVEPIAGLRFIWRSGSADIGVPLPRGDAPFVLELSPEAWLEVRDKLIPFIGGSFGYNWLSEEGEVSVLISLAGTW